jgi:hypothetical protein
MQFSIFILLIQIKNTQDMLHFSYFSKHMNIHVVVTCMMYSIFLFWNLYSILFRFFVIVGVFWQHGV